jgi:hypothetical protein
MILIGAIVSFQLVDESTIVISFLCYVCIILLHLANQYIYNKKNNAELTANFNELIDDRKILFSKLIAKQYQKRVTLLNVLIFVVMLWFPVVYLLATFKNIDNDQILMAYGIGSLIGKVLFCSYMTNTHMNLQTEVAHLIMTQATLAKHALEVKSTG